MSRTALVALTVVATLALCGWQRPQKSSRGFHLPDGDPVAGQAAFVEMRCHSCHRAEGVELPAPVADPPVPVVLGGRRPYARTDGELVTAIVDPSRSITFAGLADTRAGKCSRMGDFGDTLTVSQLTDIVAFVQAQTKVEAEPVGIR